VHRNRFLYTADRRPTVGEVEMAKFRKKYGEVIEAVKYRGDGKVGSGQIPDWLWRALEDGTCHSTNGTDPFIIETLAGDMTVSPGDWIILGSNGELSKCELADFPGRYELVEE
jgi:hypothetical protein